MQNILKILSLNKRYIFFTLFVSFDLLFIEESISCQLDSHRIGNVSFLVMVVSASAMMIIVDHLGSSVVGVVVVRTGIDSQGVFGGSRLGLPGLQCTIIHPPTTTNTNITSLPYPPMHHHPPPPTPISLHRHAHQTTSIPFNSTTNRRFTSIPREHHQQHFISTQCEKIGCILLFHLCGSGRSSFCSRAPLPIQLQVFTHPKATVSPKLI